MPSSRIKVTYFKSQSGHLVGEVRWLDVATGDLYRDPHSDDLVGRRYNLVSFGVYANGGNEVHSVTSEPARLAVPQDGDAKYDSDKSNWALLMGGCAKALEGVAAVLTFGAKKYSAHSWKTVPNGAERYRAALYRHLNAYEQGEEVDPESGLPHLYHVVCNALFIAELEAPCKK